MNLTKKSIRDVSLTGKRVLLRVDFNVPINEAGKISSDRRIRAAIPTIRYLLDHNVRSVVLISHLGRPDGRVVEKYSLRHVAKLLEQLVGQRVLFLNDCVGREVETRCGQCENGGLVMLENLRFHLEEEGRIRTKDGTVVCAKPDQVCKFRESLSRLGEVYVNDAFGTLHRSHSSIVGISAEVRVAGLLVSRELEFFSKLLRSPARPFVAIVGGSKVSDKIPLIRNLLGQIDEIIIGGGMSYTFRHVLDKMPIGDSLFDSEASGIVSEIWRLAQTKNVAIHLPVDYVVANRFHQDAQIGMISTDQGIEPGWMGMDIGPRTRLTFSKVLQEAKTVVWNGPMGVFEMKPFQDGTRAVLEAVVKSTENGAVTVVGGGDTATAVEDWKMEHLLSHVSTGGGASLELLEGKILPGLEAICD